MIPKISPGDTFGFTQTYNSIARVLNSKVLISQSFDPQNTKNPPKQREFIAIWDTGATGSCITPKVVSECNLLPIGMTNISVVGGTKRSRVYLINIMLPNHVGFAELKVTEGEISGADMLLGMDIMCQGDMALTNYNKKTMLSFRIPSIGSIDLKDHSPPPAQQKPVVKKVSRNAPCPCGSGKKYKKCCGK